MQTLRKAIRPTTIIRSSKLNDRLGIDLTIASETFQHTGSFKFRAAYNVVLNNHKDEFIGVSSGNFGQALAYACKLLGRRCTVVMPHNSASVKVAAVRAFGAVADLIDVRTVSRAARMEQLANQRPDAYMASAYDDSFVIDGNATLGEELAGLDFEAVVVPVGGGGLISGVVNSLRVAGSRAEIFGAEPLLANDVARSMRAGELIANEREPQTVADGARTLSAGKLNWPIIRDGVSGVVEVPEQLILDSVRLYFELANLKSEPTSGLALGAVLADPARFRGKRVCIVVTGGNVDPGLYAKILRP